MDKRIKGKESDGLIAHGSILLAATIISGAANYLFHIYMSRALSTEDYGILFSLLAILMVVAVPAGSVHTVIMKYISSFKAKSEDGKIAFLFSHLTKKLFFFSAVLLTVFVFLAGPLSTFLKIPSRMPVVIVGLVLMVSMLGPVALGTLQGLQRFAFLGVIIIFGSFLRVVFGILLVHFGFGVNGALASSFFAALIAFLVAFVSLSPLLKREQKDTDVETGEIYKFFVPTMLAFVCFNLLTYIDVALVKHFFSPLQAGHYSRAAVVGKAFLFPPMALAGAMFPKVSGSRDNSRFLLNKTLLFSLLVLLFGIVICFFSPKFILTVLVRKDALTPLALSTTIPLLKVFGMAMAPFALSYVLIYYNLACHKTRFLYFLACGSLLQMVLLSIFHRSLLQVMLVLSLSGSAILVSLLLLTYSHNLAKKPAKGS